MLWRLMDGSREAFCGSYAACLDYAEERDWIARHFHDDGTEFAPHWRTRGIVLAPVLSAEADGRAHEVARVPVLAAAAIVLTGFGAFATAAAARAGGTVPTPDRDQAVALIVGAGLGALAMLTVVLLHVAELRALRRRLAREDARQAEDAL